MNPIHHALKVVKRQVLDIELRYDGYHADLVNKLVEVIAKQDLGFSNQRRKSEVESVVKAFGTTVFSKKRNDTDAT